MASPALVSLELDENPPLVLRAEPRTALCAEASAARSHQRGTWRRRRGRGRADGSPSTTCRLFGIVASHVASAERLDALLRMLVSIDQQRPTRPRRVIVSWSATPPMRGAVQEAYRQQRESERQRRAADLIRLLSEDDSE